MCRRIDLTGMRFGRLTVIEYSHMVGKHSYWKCVCDCGKQHFARIDCLKSGLVKSCGCLNIIAHEKPESVKKHKLYRVYWGMKQRCYNSNTRTYKYYGARGIRVCDDWLNNYESFFNWSLKNGYEEGLSIDRINNDGNYEPSNCRWVTASVQNTNKRRRGRA